MVICLEQSTSDLHIVQMMSMPTPSSLASLNPERFSFLVPAYSGYPGKEAIKQVLLVLGYHLLTLLPLTMSMTPYKRHLIQ